MRGTHWLKRGCVRTDQDMETKQGSEGGSRSGEGRCQDWSGDGNKVKQ